MVFSVRINTYAIGLFLVVGHYLQGFLVIWTVFFSYVAENILNYGLA